MINLFVLQSLLVFLSLSLVPFHCLLMFDVSLVLGLMHLDHSAMKDLVCSGYPLLFLFLECVQFLLEQPVIFLLFITTLIIRTGALRSPLRRIFYNLTVITRTAFVGLLCVSKGPLCLSIRFHHPCVRLPEARRSAINLIRTWERDMNSVRYRNRPRIEIYWLGRGCCQTLIQ